MQGPVGGLGGAGSLSSDAEEPAMGAERQGAANGRRTSARRKGARPQRCVFIIGFAVCTMPAVLRLHRTTPLLLTSFHSCLVHVPLVASLPWWRSCRGGYWFWQALATAQWQLARRWLRSATSEEELAAEQYLDYKAERGAADPELGYGQVGAGPHACLPFSCHVLITPQVFWSLGCSCEGYDQFVPSRPCASPLPLLLIHHWWL